MIEEESKEERTLLAGLLFYWKIVWSYRILIIVITFLGAIISVTFALISIKLPPGESPLPNVYKAYTKLVIHSDTATDGSSTLALMEMMGMEVSSGTISDNGTRAQLIYNSYPFADVVVKRLNFSEKYGIPSDNRIAMRNIFYGNSSLSYSTRTKILVLTYQSIDKYFAADVVEVMLEELALWFANEGGVSSQNQITVIENKLLDINNEIENLSSKIKGIQKKYGALNIEDIAATQQELINSLTSRLIDIDIQLESHSNIQSSYSILETSAVKALRSQREDISNMLRRLKNGQEVGGKVYPPYDEMPDIAYEFNRLKLLLQIQEQIYLSLTEKYEVLKLAGSSTFNYTVLEPVEVPWNKSGPKRSMICIYMTIGCFFIGVALALLLTLIKSFYKGRDERLTL